MQFAARTPQRISYDPAAPVYAVGDTVYIEDDAYQITELRDDTVQLLPTGMVYPIYRAEHKEQFEQLLRADRRNAYYTEFLPVDPDKVDQDLRDVLAHGLMDEADKKQVSTLLQSGRSNSEIAYWLSRAYFGEIETLDLETGDIADYRTTAQGIELKSWMQRKSVWLCCIFAGMRLRLCCAGCMPASWTVLDRNAPNRLLKPRPSIPRP